MRSIHLALLLGSVTVGCYADPYTVTQAGTTPAPRPMLYDGQPLAKGGRIEGRSTTVMTPVGDGDKESGNFVARQHSDLALRTARGDFDAGLEVGIAWTKGAQAASPELGPKADSSGAVTVKFSGRHSFKLNDQLRLGAAVSMGVVSVPVVLSADPSNTENAEALVFEVGIVPSWRSGPLAIFGGINFTNDTYIPRSVVVDGSDLDSEVPEANADGAVVFSAGMSYTLPSGLHLTAQLGQPLSELAHHGLQLDLGLGFDFGSQPAPKPAGPPPPPPGYYYPPPGSPPPVTTPPPAGPGGAPGST